MRNAVLIVDVRLVGDAIQPQATGYLVEGPCGPKLLECICAPDGLAMPIGLVSMARLLKGVHPPACDAEAEHRKGPLTRRELDVLKLCGKGFNFGEVARLLGLSRHTVTTLVKRIYRKLQVHSKTEALFEARRLDLLVE